MKFLYTFVYLLSFGISLSFATVFEERDGMIVIEAEAFNSQAKADVRRWYVFDSDTAEHKFWDSDATHLEGASGGAYIEILPDTRTNHGETLVRGENFTEERGSMAVLSYSIQVNKPGRYFIWGRAFSTGPEDNGAHFGLNGQWPQSSGRLQFCKGKHQWTWSSAQRRPENHCGDPRTLWIDIEEAGVHTFMLSMREDGFELDKIVLTLDEAYQPEGEGPPATVYQAAELPERDWFREVSAYRFLLKSASDFKSDAGEIPYYIDQGNRCLAIDARKHEYRGPFAAAEFTVGKSQKGEGDLVLVTLAELDGESDYRVSLNNKLIAEFKNPETDVDYSEVYFTIPDVTLSVGDVLKVESNAVTNGKIPEGDGTAFARGRWIGIYMSR